MSRDYVFSKTDVVRIEIPRNVVPPVLNWMFGQKIAAITSSLGQRTSIMYLEKDDGERLIAWLLDRGFRAE
jgi:hypothetical protein